MVTKTDVLLIGPRRTGKTSAIKEYLSQEKKKNEEFCSSFIDLEGIENLYEFYARIIQNVYSDANKLGAVGDKALGLLKNASNFLNEIFPEGVDLSIFTGVPKSVMKAPKFEAPKVEDLRKTVSALLLDLKKPFTIVLDEFPEVIWKLGRYEDGEEAQIAKRKDEPPPPLTAPLTVPA
jgi:Cdc6-like AAA superfamily ATPase